MHKFKMNNVALVNMHLPEIRKEQIQFQRIQEEDPCVRSGRRQWSPWQDHGLHWQRWQCYTLV